MRVLIADDHEILRAGLRSLLQGEPDIEVVGEAADGRSALKLAKQLKPDVIIVDIGMPEMNGIDATRRIVAEVPGVKVLALSMHADRRFVTQMLDVGASGYLLKDCAMEELAFSLKALRENRLYLSPGVAGVVVDSYLKRVAGDAGAGRPGRLSGREREVLQMIAEGQSTAAIAENLSLSVKTIESHRKNIMDKLGIFSVVELTKYAIREGLTSI